MFRLFQIMVLLAIPAMMGVGALLFMLSSNKEVLAQLGKRLLFISPIIGISSLILANIVWRNDHITLAYAILGVPPVIWVGLLSRLPASFGQED